MATQKSKAHIRRLIERDLSERADNLRRAKIEHSRGLMSAEELKDYEDDVKTGEETMAYFMARAD